MTINRIFLALALCLALMPDARAAASCEPADAGGKGTRLIGASDPAIGKWTVYFCELDRYTWQMNYAYVRAQDERPITLAAIREALGSPADWRITVAKHFGTDHCKRDGVQWRAQAGYEAICGALQQTVAVHRPRWTVVPNIASSDQSRPVYRVKDGVRNRAAVDGVRAAANARCWCKELAVIEGSSTWCVADDIDPKDTPDLVTLCSKVTP